jgi:hypothetical protein
MGGTHAGSTFLPQPSFRGSLSIAVVQRTQQGRQSNDDQNAQIKRSAGLCFLSFDCVGRIDEPQ